MKSKKEVEIVEEMFPSHRPATRVNPEGGAGTKMENLWSDAFPTLKNLTPGGEACRSYFLNVVDNISYESSCGNVGAFGEGLGRADGCNKSPV